MSTDSSTAIAETYRDVQATPNTGRAMARSEIDADRHRARIGLPEFRRRTVTLKVCARQTSFHQRVIGGDSLE